MVSFQSNSRVAQLEVKDSSRLIVFKDQRESILPCDILFVDTRGPSGDGQRVAGYSGTDIAVRGMSLSTLNGILAREQTKHADPAHTDDVYKSADGILSRYKYMGIVETFGIDRSREDLANRDTRGLCAVISAYKANVYDYWHCNALGRKFYEAFAGKRIAGGPDAQIPGQMLYLLLVKVPYRWLFTRGDPEETADAGSHLLAGGDTRRAAIAAVQAPVQSRLIWQFVPFACPIGESVPKSLLSRYDPLGNNGWAGAAIRVGKYAWTLPPIRRKYGQGALSLSEHRALSSNVFDYTFRLPIAGFDNNVQDGFVVKDLAVPSGVPGHRTENVREGGLPVIHIVACPY
jgi:hypothetical protein